MIGRLVLIFAILVIVVAAAVAATGGLFSREPSGVGQALADSVSEKLRLASDIALDRRNLEVSAQDVCKLEQKLQDAETRKQRRQMRQQLAALRKKYRNLAGKYNDRWQGVFSPEEAAELDIPDTAPTLEMLGETFCNNR